MIVYQEACKKVKRDLSDYFQHYDKLIVTEIKEGWVFVFGKTGVDLTPAPSRLVVKETGEIKGFPIPPISNLQKLRKGKKIKFIDE